MHSHKLRGLHQYSSLGLLALRLGVATMFIYHGITKWAMFGAPSDGSTLQMIMKVLAVVEPIMGVLVLIGLFTELAAIVLGVVMIGAIYTKMQVWGIPFAAPEATGWEFDVMILAGCIALAFNGAGQYSVDAKCCADKTTA